MRNIFRDAPMSLLRKLGATVDLARPIANSAAPTPIEVGEHYPPQAADRALDAELIEILEGQRRWDETIATAFQRKERTLGEAFSRLDVADARAMHARLSSPHASDRLVVLFNRLAAERRQRLLDYLRGAPRRFALGSGR
ncbi:MAG: hypothetical protein KIT31_16270 [Deltaproteobacteria bacterium]|nr:hypothetical protein [Deltaproteobacteria bacterium]